jgi:septum formation protein
MWNAFILGSRSPRRIELLSLLVPVDRIEVYPPTQTEEPGFEGLHDRAAIEEQLLAIAKMKFEDVRQQVLSWWHQATYPPAVGPVIAADTSIIATEPDGTPVVLGQPPNDAGWPDVVRHWFRHYYAGRSHVAATALYVGTPDGRRAQRIVETEVTFHPDVDRWLDWYISTGEPVGKAGGYGLQGAGSLFVSHVAGSTSNVVGLPLRELLEIFEELNVSVPQHVRG